MKGQDHTGNWPFASELAALLVLAASTTAFCLHCELTLALLVTACRRDCGVFLFRCAADALMGARLTILSQDISAFAFSVLPSKVIVRNACFQQNEIWPIT